MQGPCPSLILSFGSKAGDCSLHYEVLPNDGDYDFLSYSTWAEMKGYCASLGVAEGDWPDFTDYPDTIDLPLDRVLAKQHAFREAIHRLPTDALARSIWLTKIAEYLANGEVVFFC
jgi:hypothetical protein